MSSADLFREWGWAVAFVLALLLLVFLLFGRRRGALERRERPASRERAPETTPAQFLRARVQFLVALALLAAVLFVYAMSVVENGG